MHNSQPRPEAVKKSASTGKQQDQPLSFKTTSNLTSSPRTEHPIHREWGVENTAASKQRSIQQRTSSPLKDDPPMLQHWLAESAKDQPYGNVDAFYSVGGKR